MIFWIILGTCKTAKECAFVQCTKDGEAVPVPAPPPAPAQNTCDMRDLFDYYGIHPFTASIQLMIENNGNKEKKLCQNSN